MTQQPWGQPQPQPGQQWGQPQQPQWGAPQQQQWGQPQQQWGQAPGGFGGQWGQQVPQVPQQQWGQQQPGGEPNGPWGQAPSAYPPAPPAKKKSPLMGLLIGLIVTTLLVGGIVAALVALRGGGSDPNGPYVNETYKAPPPDKNPPPLPEPTSQAELDDMTKSNKLYGQEVPKPIKCELQDVDMASASKSQLEQHLNGFVECLMGQWHTPMEKAGFQMPRPSVTVYESAVTTACGKLPMRNAVYCPADQQVYYAKNLAEIIPGDLKGSRWMPESVIAHEFGHAVQARQGVLASYYIAREQSSSKSEANALSRRVELQADCYAGAFLGAVEKSAKLSGSDYDKLGKLFASIGDDKLSGNPNIDGNHGMSYNRQKWLGGGREADKYSKCNTWTASTGDTK